MSPMTKAFWLPGLKIVHHVDVLEIGVRNDFSDPLLLPRDWLDQLTTHAYTSAPDIVLCGNKVLPEY